MTAAGHGGGAWTPTKGSIDADDGRDAVELYTRRKVVAARWAA